MAAGSQSSGSVWMPLIAGYMINRMMGLAGFTQNPLFATANAGSSDNDKFVDSTSKSYGAVTAGGRAMTVPKTAIPSKPALTHTITRSGFGETVAKHNSL